MYNKIEMPADDFIVRQLPIAPEKNFYSRKIKLTDLIMVATGQGDIVLLSSQIMIIR